MLPGLGVFKISIGRPASMPWIAALAAFAIVSGARAEPAALTVTTAAGESRSYTLADLAAMPVVTVNAVNDHQPAADYSGVELHDVLVASGVAQGKELRGKHVAEYAVIVARDGYRAVFSLPEFDPAFAQRRIFLAWKKDGQPLPETEGPLRMIIPDEKHPTRWVRQVTSIRILAAPDTP